jgi:hypothetical protein
MSNTSAAILVKGIGAPIIFGRCPSLSAHERESMLRTYLACREKLERERGRETSKRHVRKAQCTNNSDPITSTSELLQSAVRPILWITEAYDKQTIDTHAMCKRVISANCWFVALLQEVGADIGEHDEIVRFPHKCIYNIIAHSRFTLALLIPVLRKELTYPRDEIKQGKSHLQTYLMLYLPPRNHEEQHSLKPVKSLFT